MLKFNREEVEEFIYELEYAIEELEDELVELEEVHDSLQGQRGASAAEYGEYSLDIADCKNSIAFYEVIKVDLEEFLEEVDSNAMFTRDPNFKYDEELIEEVKSLREDFTEMVKVCGMDTSRREETPFGYFGRGNVLHHDSPEEQLIDSNDGKMENLADELNKGIREIQESFEEIVRLHRLYFENISLEDLKREHDQHDGIAENSRKWHSKANKLSVVVGIGATMTTSASMSKPKATIGVTTGIEAEEVSTSASVVEIAGPTLPKENRNITYTELTEETFNNHIDNVDMCKGVNIPGYTKKGVSGGHNMNNFYIYLEEGMGLTKSEIQNMIVSEVEVIPPGDIYDIEYQQPKQESKTGVLTRDVDGNLEFKNKMSNKTVFDPNVYPPENIKVGISEAIADYEIKYNPDNGVFDENFKIVAQIEDINGNIREIDIKVHLDEKGNVTSAYPIKLKEGE